MIRRVLLGLGVFALCFFVPIQPVEAAGFGAHVLRAEEMSRVAELLGPQNQQPVYVTVPFTLADTQRLVVWQQAFDRAREKNVIPIVRLATEFNSETQAWEVPTKKNIVDFSRALNSLQWPQEQRHVILFNEPNHAKEWGGKIDPHEFARISLFAAQWFQTDQKSYVVLPAAMDLAAPDGKVTKEAFGYWREVLGSKPELLDMLSAWNSHSYPNPGFASAPQRTAQNSLRGFQHEISFLQRYSSRDWSVYITETGWDSSAISDRQLLPYYRYAIANIWSSSQVVAVTPFLLAGSPGPFSGFSLVDQEGKPTTQGKAFTQALSLEKDALLTDRSLGKVLQ